MIKKYWGTEFEGVFWYGFANFGIWKVFRLSYVLRILNFAILVSSSLDCYFVLYLLFSYRKQKQ